MLVLSAQIGCQPGAKVVLLQPDAPPAQRELALSSGWAFSADAPDERRWLLAFPLPGAEDGPRDFVLFLATPTGRSEVVIRPGDPAAGRGFLIQAVGTRAGKTELVDGSIRVEDALLSRRLVRLKFDLRTDDGSQIRGSAYVEHAPSELSAFTRGHSADIAAISPPNPAALAGDLQADSKPTPPAAPPADALAPTSP